MFVLMDKNVCTGMMITLLVLSFGGRCRFLNSCELLVVMTQIMTRHEKNLNRALFDCHITAVILA